MKQLTSPMNEYAVVESGYGVLNSKEWLEHEMARINSHGGKAFIKEQDGMVSLMLEKSAPWAKVESDLERCKAVYKTKNEPTKS